MRIEDIQRVLIVGSGTMGGQIGFQCAMHGYKVALNDIAPDAFETAKTQLRAYADQLVAKERLTAEEADASLARIMPTSDPEEAAAGADLLSESLPENPELKCKVFAHFNELCPPHTIFTTYTSTLLPSMLAAATGRPTQFAAFHFHPYVWDCNVVDIMPHPGTSKGTMSLLKSFAKKIGQIPIVLAKESPSYVYNAIQGAWFDAALTLAIDGVTSVENIDRAWMGVRKSDSGPFGVMDLIGLDVIWNINQYWAKVVGSHYLQTRANFIKKYIDKGRLGVKSGRGFYSYPDPAYKKPEFFSSE